VSKQVREEVFLALNVVTKNTQTSQSSCNVKDYSISTLQEQKKLVDNLADPFWHHVEDLIK